MEVCSVAAIYKGIEGRFLVHHKGPAGIPR